MSVLSKLGYDALITNRVSNTVKQEMKDKYGYTFEWKGHDVSWNDSTSILVHYLESFYTVPTVRLDNQFIQTSANGLAGALWGQEISPSIQGLKS